MSKKEREIEVPGNVYVECPLIEKKLRLVIDCIGCEHFAGVKERFGDSKKPFRERFQVACRFPFARAIFEIEVKDAGTL